MKLERVSEHIWSLKIWVMIPVRVWLVKDKDGVTLVDAGLSVMTKGIIRTIERLNVGPLRRILLTHGHSDHVGAIPGILAHAPIPVFAHRIEIPYMEGEKAYPRRKKAQASVPREIVVPLHEASDGSLQPVSGLMPYLTPGHSPGHVVYYHEADRVLIGGDLLMSRRGRLRRPMAMFTSDMAEAIRSSEILRQLKPLRLEVCHAAPVNCPAEQLKAFLKAGAPQLTHPS